MRNALTIAGKDLRLRLRDRSAFIVGIIAPLGLAFIFNLVLGDVAEGSIDLNYGVLNQDEGGTGSQFVAAMRDADQAGVLSITELSTTNEAESAVEAGELASVFVVPASFSSDVASNQTTEIDVLADVDSPTASQIAVSIAQRFAAEVQTVRLAVGAAVASGAEPGPDLFQKAAGLPHPVSVNEIEAAHRELDLTTFFVAGMAVFFLFFTVQFGVLSLLEEKQEGTLARLRAAPIGWLSVIAAKAIVSLVLGVVSMVVLIVASTLLMGAKWGDPLGVALLVLAGVISAVGIMAVVAAFARTPEGAGNLQAILAVGLGMLGGIFFPASLGEGLIARLSYISPHRWFMTGLADLAGGGGVGPAMPSVAALLAFGLVTAALAYPRLSRGSLA
jgi:ABC-2 type transport system permease protein